MLDDDGGRELAVPDGCDLIYGVQILDGLSFIRSKNVCDHLRVVEWFGVAPEYTRRQ